MHACMCRCTETWEQIQTFRWRTCWMVAPRCWSCGRQHSPVRRIARSWAHACKFRGIRLLTTTHGSHSRGCTWGGSVLVGAMAFSWAGIQKSSPRNDVQHCTLSSRLALRHVTPTFTGAFMGSHHTICAIKPYRACMSRRHHIIWAITPYRA